MLFNVYIIGFPSTLEEFEPRIASLYLLFIFLNISHDENINKTINFFEERKIKK